LRASALQQEINLLTDWFTDEIFGGLAGANDVIFPVSRLVVDPERFEDDEQEPMAGRGMGVVYERTSNHAPLRHKLSVGERQALIDDYYRPHHQALSGLTRKMIAEHDQCFILDGHSFPSDRRFVLVLMHTTHRHRCVMQRSNYLKKPGSQLQSTTRLPEPWWPRVSIKLTTVL